MTLLFWNTDTQFDFMRKHGELYVPHAEKIEGNLCKLTYLASKYGIKVVNTLDAHTNESKELSETPDYKLTFPRHCIVGTFGMKNIVATAPMNVYTVKHTDKELNEENVRNYRNISIWKDTFDVFNGNPHTDRIVEIINPSKVFIYGVVASVCVHKAITGLLEHNIKVCVVEDAIMDLPDTGFSTDVWVKNGVELIKTNNVEQYLMQNV